MQSCEPAALKARFGVGGVPAGQSFKVGPATGRLDPAPRHAQALVAVRVAQPRAVKMQSQIRKKKVGGPEYQSAPSSAFQIAGKDPVFGLAARVTVVLCSVAGNNIYHVVHCEHLLVRRSGAPVVLRPMGAPPLPLLTRGGLLFAAAFGGEEAASHRDPVERLRHSVEPDSNVLETSP